MFIKHHIFNIVLIKCQKRMLTCCTLNLFNKSDAFCSISQFIWNLYIVQFNVVPFMCALFVVSLSNMFSTFVVLVYFFFFIVWRSETLRIDGKIKTHIAIGNATTTTMIFSPSSSFSILIRMSLYSFTHRLLSTLTRESIDSFRFCFFFLSRMH